MSDQIACRIVFFGIANIDVVYVENWLSFVFFEI